jgi:fatty acid-binding protein DegV
MIELAADLGQLEQIALLHIRGNGRLNDFKQQSRPLFIDNEMPLTVELTPALGAHIGPGGLGIACVKASNT